MGFRVEVEREVFGELAFYDGDVLGEDLVVEVEGVLDGRVFVEVAAERDEEAGFAGGDWGGGVHDVEEAAAGEFDGEFGGEGEEDFEAAVPLEAGWVEVLVGVGVVADGADVVGDEAVGFLGDGVVGDDGVVGFAEAFFVNEGEVTDIEKPFDLQPAAAIATLSGSTCK